MCNIVCERVYEHKLQKGYKILVDRLWPRGIKKTELKYDLWYKDITPSAKIRKEFGHKEENFERFKMEYLSELDNNPKGEEFLRLVFDKLKKENIVLLFASKNTVYNHVVILKEWLENKLTDKNF